MASRTHFEHNGPGVFIICRVCSKRRGEIIILPAGETFWGPVRDAGSRRTDISVRLADCPDHRLVVDSRELADAVAKARRLRKVVVLRATPR